MDFGRRAGEGRGGEHDESLGVPPSEGLYLTLGLVPLQQAARCGYGAGLRLAKFEEDVEHGLRTPLPAGRWIGELGAGGEEGKRERGERARVWIGRGCGWESGCIVESNRIPLMGRESRPYCMKYYITHGIIPLRS